MKPNKWLREKINIIVVMVITLLIVSVGVFYYFFNPKNESKTFSGRIFGSYSVEYPAGWTVEEKGSGTSFEYTLITRKTDNNFQGDYDITIMRLHKTLGNLESCAKKRGEDSSLEKTKIADLDALKAYTKSVRGRPAVTNYYFTWDGYDYLVGVLHKGETDNTSIKILDTLKFNS